MKVCIMKKWNKSIIAVATALCMGAVGLSATALAAQTDENAVQKYNDVSPAPNKKRLKPKRMDAEQMKQFAAQKQSELHDKLNLSSSQENAWKIYNDATMQNLPSPKPGAPGDFAKLTAPERMQKALDVMKERQAKMENQLKAVKAFYAELTPEQKKIFDAETLPKHPRDKIGPHRKPRPRDRDMLRN